MKPNLNFNREIKGEGERERETDRQTDRQTERDRETERDRDRERQRQRQRQRQTEKERERESSEIYILIKVLHISNLIFADEFLFHAQNVFLLAVQFHHVVVPRSVLRHEISHNFVNLHILYKTHKPSFWLMQVSYALISSVCYLGFCRRIAERKFFV